MVMEGDTGYYLRVMATYTDAAGTDMAMEYSMPTMMVGEAMPPGGTELERLIARYDTSGDSNIDKGELFDAINDYLGFGSGPSWDSEGYTKKGAFRPHKVSTSASDSAKTCGSIGRGSHLRRRHHSLPKQTGP